MRGRATHFIAVKEDVTAQKRAEDLLRMNATVFDTTTEGIMVTDAENRIKTVNPAFSRITGYELSEVVGRNPSILSSGRQKKLFYQEMWETVLHQGHWSGEIWNRRKDGSVYPQWLSVASIKDEKGRVSEYVAIFSDITQRKENEEQIRYQANYDALTGLPNRSLLQDRLSQAIMSAGREEWGLALLFIDLDKFKVVNDSFGHVIGDELLQKVATRIKACVREVDTVARFGGDEFVVLLQDISEPEDAAKVASKIIETVSRVFELSSRETFVGASIGITLYPEDADTPDTLLQNADMAMYLAKDTGRNRFQFFTAKIQEQVRIRQSLEHDLRTALKREEFELYYQPVVDAGNESIVSVEALLRWHHPQLGFVAPDTFIPLAEEIGLIGIIGMWILHTGCRQVHEWHQTGLSDIEIAFNLSGRQRELGLTAKDISLILHETGLSGEFITLEITESELIEDTAEEITWLQSFKNVGAKLSIDDFGTGYSSLSYLKRFPVDILKIDRAFVADLPDNQDDASLVEAIVAIAKSLNLKLVAEGVETKAQADFLKKIGCDYLQGYYFGKPMPATELTDMIGVGTNPSS
ncbi:MAG: EAL domain-containing protein [gamma proteobacterium endosymbiont of Lamellibrachia anaximandri]|nr:EAL domain-containing protein [gamma proteobacterium endosymbiont of Lamellibrachia anaximandri]